eukprot:TRINITY_DN326_c0_g1_i1.p1 TRINITY_DN326_c0_g1~~TRINITY_DN326_c0_g1_i1.p1  ORF type:complete len:548 (+),score=150.68 TRINITY_DN326_c0_g1_i1:93-1646(+)
MDVTRHNFSEALSSFSAALSECNFVSIDLEMTGISQPKDHFHSKEKVDDRFHSLRKTATIFAPLQIGVCTFKEVEQMDGRVEVVAHPFQFNCIPTHIDPMLSSSFEMCASTIAFLLENNFDFQKSIRDGVPLTNSFAAVEVSRTMLCGLKNGDQQVPDSSKKGELKALYEKIEEDAIASAMEWYRGKEEKEEKEEMEEGENDNVYHSSAKFFRRTGENIVKFIDPQLKNCVVYLKPSGHGWGFVNVCIEKFNTKEDAVCRRDDLIKQRHDELHDVLGMYFVFELLVEAKKPIIGHNCLMDFLFLWRWVHQSIPQTAPKFKKELHALLPHIFDTKRLHESILPRFSPWNGTHLSCLYEYWDGVLKREEEESDYPSIKIRIGQGELKHLGSYHQGGYDAYATGVIFLSFSHLFANKHEIEVADYENDLYLFGSIMSCSLHRLVDRPLYPHMLIASYSSFKNYKEKEKYADVFRSFGVTLDIVRMDSTSDGLLFCCDDDMLAFSTLWEEKPAPGCNVFAL